MENLQDRTPPQNVEAEQAVLGAVFLQPEALITASEILMPDDFYRQGHQLIFQAMLELSDQGKAVDVVTIYEALASTGKIEDVGGLPYLTELSGAVPTAANLEYYAHIVEDKALLRRLIRTATQIATDSYAREDEVETLMDEAEKKYLGSFLP